MFLVFLDPKFCTRFYRSVDSNLEPAEGSDFSRVLVQDLYKAMMHKAVMYNCSFVNKASEVGI